MRHIPNLITTFNLAAGFIAIIFAADGDTVTASWLVLAAMIFDFLDGFSARMLKAYSDMGKELDSLADLVSFGIAPALILIKMMVPALNHMESGLPGFTISSYRIAIFIPVLMPVFAALRLAKFNIDTTQEKSFKGLPTPANAIAVISLAISYDYTSLPLLKAFAGSPSALVIYSVILSLLMVVPMQLLSLKFSDLKFRGNEGRYILIGLSLILFIIFGLDSTVLIIPVYIIVSLLNRLLSQSSAIKES